MPTQRNKEQRLANGGIGAIKQAILQCKACKFSGPVENRVIGKGSLKPILLFVGSSPGALEGGQLENMVKALKLTSEQWAATNYFKCPIKEPVFEEEFQACSKFFGAQIYFLEPQAVVILGEIAIKGVTSRVIEYGEICEFGLNHWMIKVLPLEALDSASNIKKQKEYLNEFRRTLEQRSILSPVYH
jgi:DNA polymerase